MSSDKEVATIRLCAKRLSELDTDAQKRALYYLVSLFASKAGCDYTLQWGPPKQTQKVFFENATDTSDTNGD